MICKQCGREYSLDIYDVHFDNGLCDICNSIEIDGNLVDATELFEKKRLQDEWWRKALKRVHRIGKPVDKDKKK